jgi:colanic acid/amylovoran biosynthesis glycosyltransferase
MKKKMVWYRIFVVVSIFSFHILHCKKPLHILFIVGHFPVPSQVFILNMMTGLIDQGHNVSIFSFNKDPLVDMHPNIEKYNLLKHVSYHWLPSKLPKKCDIVFCQFGYLGQKIFSMPQLSEWLQKRKVVVCFRGADLSSYLEKSPGMYKKVLKQADLFLPVCDYFKKKLIALGCKNSKIIVHHSAIDCSQFFFTIRHKPVDNRINMVSVCRLVKKKGIDDAIHAFAEIVKKYPWAHYYIVGDGPERTYLELLIYQLDLQDHVTLCGWKTHDEVIAMLDRSHIFVLPSRKGSDGNEEGIANALKEAMAMGLISIGTWHAGTPELIDDGISGFLVPEQNVVQLTKTIEHVIEHPEIWETIGLAARKKVEDEFETKRSMKRLERLFYALLA